MVEGVRHGQDSGAQGALQQVNQCVHVADMRIELGIVINENTSVGLIALVIVSDLRCRMLNIAHLIWIVVMVAGMAGALFLGHFDVILMLDVNGRCEAVREKKSRREQCQHEWYQWVAFIVCNRVRGGLI